MTAAPIADSTIAMSTASHARDVEGVGDGVGDERAHHRHLALGEVDDAGRLEDQHQRQRHRRVDEAVAQAVEDALEEQLRTAVVDRPDGEGEDEDRRRCPARSGGTQPILPRQSHPDERRSALVGGVRWTVFTSLLLVPGRPCGRHRRGAARRRCRTGRSRRPRARRPGRRGRARCWRSARRPASSCPRCG